MPDKMTLTSEMLDELQRDCAVMERCLEGTGVSVVTVNLETVRALIDAAREKLAREERQLRWGPQSLDEYPEEKLP